MTLEDWTRVIQIVHQAARERPSCTLITTHEDAFTFGRGYALGVIVKALEEAQAADLEATPS